ncbi:gab-1 [Symbiodinium sp. CCMP2592]|nr:gab-1 [Symbiodinium sp. CCMP2592]
MWCPGSDLPSGKKVSLLYVRYCDKHYAYGIQRSCATILIHLQRDGSYYFHSVLLMAFMVNLVSLCGLRISLSHLSGRLGHLITCFLAVLAYRYVIDDKLPQKQYMTAADWYILSPCVFLVLLCIETVTLSACGREGVLTSCKTSDQDMLDRYTGIYRFRCGSGMDHGQCHAILFVEMRLSLELQQRLCRQRRTVLPRLRVPRMKASLVSQAVWKQQWEVQGTSTCERHSATALPEHVEGVSSTGSQSLRRGQTNESNTCGTAEKASRGQFGDVRSAASKPNPLVRRPEPLSSGHFGHFFDR